MDNVTRRKLSMAAKARDFALGHPSTNAGQLAVVARLTERVRRADALAVQEQEGRLTEQASTERRRSLRRTIHRQHLRHLVNTARLASSGNPPLEALFQLPNVSTSNIVFLTAAKAMLASATEHREALEAGGLSDTFVTDLTAAIAEHDAASTEWHASRAARVGANADLPEVTAECLALVKVLDGLVRAQFAKDPERIGAWESATNVYAYTPVRRASSSVPGAGSVASVPLPAAVQPGMAVQVM